MAMDPDIAAHLAAWRREKSRLKKVGEFPGKRKGGYSEFTEKGDIDTSDSPAYNWGDHVDVTDDNYTKDEDEPTYDNYTQDEEDDYDVGELLETVDVASVTAYNQGPASSSRVLSFRFEPTETATEENVAGETLSGYIVVTFIKRAYNKPSNVVQYGPLKLSHFNEFKSERTFSLGQAVVDLESHGFSYV